MKVNPKMVLVLPDSQKEEDDKKKLVFKENPEDFTGTVVSVGKDIETTKDWNPKSGSRVHYRPHDGFKVFLKSSKKYHLVFLPDSILILE